MTLDGALSFFRRWWWQWIALAVVVACTLKVLFFGGFGIFVMSPARVDACQQPQGVPVEIKWLALSRSGTRFTVHALGARPMLWKEAGRMGAARTAPFSEGMTLVMSDMDGHLLWRQTMTATCTGR